jgi:DNA-directed RNA polymerase specialized sigma24 family protein
LLHWLKKIATRVGYRHWKQRRRWQQRTVPLSDETAAALVDPGATQSARQAGELVHHLLGQLAPRDRLVITLMYLESCTTAEIAEVLDSEQRERWQRMFHKLRETWLPPLPPE